MSFETFVETSFATTVNTLFPEHIYSEESDHITVSLDMNRGTRTVYPVD